MRADFPFWCTLALIHNGGMRVGFTSLAETMLKLSKERKPAEEA